MIPFLFGTAFGVLLTVLICAFALPKGAEL